VNRGTVGNATGGGPPGKGLLRSGTALFGLALLAGTASLATATSKSTTPTAVDLVQYGGYGSTVTVLLVNFTPYTLTYKTSSMEGTDTLIGNRHRDQKKSFMFAPLGVPKSIPPIDTTTVKDEGGQTLYLEPHAQTNYHAYPFVVSWDDRNGMIEQTSITWTVKNVCYPSIGTDATTCQPNAGVQRQDVDLTMWFERQDETPRLASSLFRAVQDITKLAFETAALVESGGSKVAWVCEFLALKETAEDVSEFVKEQTSDDAGPKMYVSVMPLPDGTSDCVNAIGPNCMPSYTGLSCDASATPDDGALVQWATSTGGNPPSRLVVTYTLLRGNWDEDNYIGRSPIVAVTMWDADWYSTAHATWRLENPCQQTAGVHRIQSHLRQGGRRALRALSRLMHSFDPQEREVFDATLRGLGSKHPLTEEQKEFLDQLALAFEKGETSLKPETPSRKGAHRGH
jgi:hypothetical protein